MKRLLLLAGIVAGTVAPYLPAQADPHDHTCVGPVDTNCVRASDGRNCDVYEEDPAGSTCIHPPTGPDYIGGCSFGSSDDSTGQVLNPHTQTGVISGTVVGFDANPTANPAETSVECWVEVNGSRVATCSTGPATGEPVATTSAQCTYTAPPGTIVQLCQTVIVNNTTVSGPGDCSDADSFEIPPPEVVDLLCSITKSVAPQGNPPLAGIDATGDVWLGGVRVLDCPPLND